MHHNGFLTLNESVLEAPILWYPYPNKRFIVYTDASNDTCGAQLSQEHDRTEFPIAFLSHTFSDTKQKWITTEQEAFGVYYTVTKCNYYLQGADIIIRNDHKPLAKFCNGKTTTNKVNRWGLKLGTYNITFAWISGACNKAADCLSWLVELPQDKSTSVNMLSTTYQDGLTFNTRSQTLQHHSSDGLTSHPQPDVLPDVTDATGPTPKSLTEVRLQETPTNAENRSIL